MLVKKKLGLVAAVALMMGLGVASTPIQAHAQETAYQRALYGQHNGMLVRPMSDPTAPTSNVTAGGDPDYTDTFAGVTSEVQGAITGPGKLAIGVMILGVIFGVVWRLISKAPKKIAGG